MKIKDYIVARDLPDAIALLEREKASARLIAGGTDVIVRARRGFFRDVTLIDITKVAELKGIALQEDGSVRIGATTRLTDIVDSPVLQEHFPIVGEAAAKVGSVQIRNMASLGGNIANASPSADTILPLLVLKTTALAEGPDGRREIALEQLFTGPGRTCLDPAEVLTGFRLPKPAKGTGMSYIKHSRRVAMDLATVNCAAAIAVDGSGSACDASVALGAVAPTPVLLPEVARYLKGRTAGEVDAKELYRLAEGRISPIEDVRAGVAYRKEMIALLLEQAVSLAYERASTPR